jgi:hypothetical protein
MQTIVPRRTSSVLAWLLAEDDDRVAGQTEIDITLVDGIPGRNSWVYFLQNQRSCVGYIYLQEYTDE